MAEPEEKTAWDKLKEGTSDLIFGPIGEIYSLMPDSLLFGSLFLYVLTQNVPFGAFALFIVELTLSHRFIAWMISGSVGPSRPLTDIRCRAGYKSAQLLANRIFSHDPYPSYSIFSISSIATYFGLSMSEFTDTLMEMGPNWEKRIMVGYIFIAFVVIAFIVLRAINCGERLGEILTSGFLAILVGFVFFHVNKKLIGIEAVNFMGLPYLVRKQDASKPIYVCATTETS
jgi:hypothetical protein